MGMLGNILGVRLVYERWMNLKPSHQVWTAYVKFELRNGEVDNIRKIYERYTACHKDNKLWIDYANFEIKNGSVIKARNIYIRAVRNLSSETGYEKILISFAQFETLCNNYERARSIYMFALKHTSSNYSSDVYKDYLSFEKIYGDHQKIEDVIISKKRFEYEQKMQSNYISYDILFDYIKMEENNRNVYKIREIYERAIAKVPPTPVKHFWQRYIYLWIKYAFFEELVMKDLEKAKVIYNTVLQLIPHKIFTFAKIWVLAAQLEIRKKNLKGARQLLGQAIGICPKEKIFKKYIEIEFYIGEINRCRKIYEKFLISHRSNCETWKKYAEMEIKVEEQERARAIYELAIQQPKLETSLSLWESYINLEIYLMERERARNLYERLLEKTKDVKVWLNYADFEFFTLKSLLKKASMIEQVLTKKKSPDYLEQTSEYRELRARSIYERAYQCMREELSENKDEVVRVLNAWKNFEQSCVTESKEKLLKRVEKVQEKIPRKVKYKSYQSLGGEKKFLKRLWYYVFPDEEKPALGLQLLEAAYKWKKKKEQFV